MPIRKKDDGSRSETCVTDTEGMQSTQAHHVQGSGERQSLTWKAEAGFLHMTRQICIAHKDAVQEGNS